MEERLAHGFVLTLELAAPRITADQADSMLRDLTHLNAVRGGLVPGLLVVHCLVSEPTEADAVRYGIQRTLTAAAGAGVEHAHILAVDVTVLETQPA